MANQTCVSSLQFCALEIIRLDPAGAPLPGAESLYVTDGPILLGFSPQTPDRASLEQVNGCGETCVSFQGPPRAANSLTTNTTLCQLDAEIAEMFAGGTLIEDAAPDTIGWAAPTDATLNVDGVAIHAYTWAWSGTSRALVGGSPGFWRFTFPKVTWTVGDVTLQNEVLQWPFDGVAVPNPSFGTGVPEGGGPTTHDYADGALWGYELVDAVPTAQCGYQEIAA